MKKIISILVLSVLIGSCKKAAIIDPVAACEKASADFSAATTAYTLEINNVKNCEAFINAAQALINNCPTLSLADKKAAQTSISSIKCN
jgi:hypothetical protein